MFGAEGLTDVAETRDERVWELLSAHTKRSLLPSGTPTTLPDWRLVRQLFSLGRKEVKVSRIDHDRVIAYLAWIF